MTRKRGLPWGRWDTDTQRNKKVLAVTPEARWAWWALVQEVRFRGLDGRISRADALEFLAGQVADPEACLKALCRKHFENPLLHKDGADLVIHDFHASDPPKTPLSTPRVQAMRARRRGEPETRFTPPSPAPPPSISPSVSDESIVSEESGEEGFEARVAAVSGWWHARTGEYAIARHVEAIARVDAPLEELLRHLSNVYDEENVTGLAYFTSGPGMGRLRELESTTRRAAGQRKGRPTALGSLVRSYDAATTSRRESS